YSRGREQTGGQDDDDDSQPAADPSDNSEANNDDDEAADDSHDSQAGDNDDDEDDDDGSSYRKWKTVILFYSFLSDEKRKDASTTAHNLKTLLADLLQREEITLATFKILVTIVDGCAAQYRCGSVLYQLCNLAKAFNIVIERIVNAPGHGKCIVDSQNGGDKTLLDIFFNCLVRNPEEIGEGIKHVLAHTHVDGEGEVSLAEICYNILNDPDRTRGCQSNKNRSKWRKIFERRYFKRGVDEAPGNGAKWLAKKSDFRKETKNSVHFTYYYRIDPQLLRHTGKMVFACRRVPCFCKGCLERLELPVDQRYVGPCNTCEYWEIFEKPNGTGYNDYNVVELIQNTKEFDEEDFADGNEFTLDTIGFVMSLQAKKGQIGAYVVDDENYDYYLVEFDSDPYQAERTETITLDGESFDVREGEWICKGRWLDRLPNTTKWWYKTPQKCIVRLQVVIHPDLKLMPLSDSNQVHNSAGVQVRQMAMENETFKIRDADHEYLLEEAINRNVLDMEYDDEFESESLSGEEDESAHPDDIDEDESEEEDEGSELIQDEPQKIASRLSAGPSSTQALVVSYLDCCRPYRLVSNRPNETAVGRIMPSPVEQRAPPVLCRLLSSSGLPHRRITQALTSCPLRSM
ncbi:hypothetical protein THAOC_14335, partial [Thalassiosira oceanica]